MKIKSILIVLSAVLLLVACRKNFDNLGWDSKVVAPIIKTSLTLENILRDTTKVKIAADKSITIVNRDSIAGISLDTLVALNTPAFEQTRKLDQIVLDERSQTSSVSFQQLLQSAGLTTLITDGSTVPFPITYGPIPVSNVAIDISNIFTSADIKTGTLELTINNGLPLDLTNVNLTLRNSGNSAIIVQRTIASVPKNTSTSISESLAGKQVEGNLLGNINLNISSSSSFVVDYSDQVQITIRVTGVKVNSATAVFPAQEVVNNTDVVVLEGLDDIRLTHATIKSGDVVAEAISTINDSLFFDYLIPGAKKNGVAFSTKEAVPPNGNKTYRYDFSGYELDLTGLSQDTFNTFVNQLIGNMKYSGNLISLSLTDSLRMRISTQNLTPSFVRGYLGRDTISLGPETVRMDLFRNIQNGTLNFEEADLRISIENGMGLPAAVKINQVRASNTRTGASALLTGPVIGVDQMIPAAVEIPYTTGNAEIVLNTASGHNTQDLLNVLPDEFTYQVTVVTNPAGFTGNMNQFAFTDKAFKASLDVSIPLSILANQLTLMDTVALSASGFKNRNASSGSIKVATYNGFPLDASVEMYLMDANQFITDTLSANSSASAASLDAAMKVKERAHSVLEFPTDEAAMQHLYNAAYVAFKVSFTTKPQAQFLKIYSTYSIDFQIIGDLQYRF
ncbi:MAG: hypothetical protein MUF42_03645 [Cytophagaceae bacterium]|nr:hypothetical protein [Cytophagaceae bacterium]